MNKGKQATLFQSWGKHSKASNQQEDRPVINLCSELNEDDDDILAEVLERSIHEYNENINSDNSYNHNSTDVCNISIGTDNSTQGQTQGPLGFDKGAGKLWIYPTNYPVRNYQFNIVSQALLKNTMVTLPTGLGKTFIAAVVMYNFFRWYPQGKVVFMAPTKPLVAQQIEACYNIMGIPQDDTAEMTGTMAPTERRKVWMEKRVFFLTPQVIMNDLSRGTCPAVNVRCLVIDEAHKATGNHAYCQVVKELVKYSNDFRILALSATPGGDIKAVQQVLGNLLISHIEIRTEDSPDIKPYSHERKVEKIVVPLGDELTNVKKKYLQIMDVTVNKLKRHGVIYKRETTSLSKFMILKAREDFRQNPPPNLQRSSYGIVEGDFALAMSLYHGFELLQLHGSRSLYNYLDGILHGDKGYGRTKTELTRNPDFNDLMNILHEKFSSCLPCQEKTSVVTGHPKVEKLEQVVLNHFNKSGDGQTRVMIFSQYRDSVNEITNILKQHAPLVKVMSFIGQSSAGKSTKGFTQKEQLKVMKEFREGEYNTLVSTCVGEEGLDIGDVDLIVCFDAHKSPIRLVQRMGRTGRKREGRIVMLVTEGKEEQIYNQSQYSKRSVHKAILNSAKTLQFYQNSPSMLPDNWNPQCHKMFITVNKKFRPTKTVNCMNQITTMMVNNDKSSSSDGGISKEDYGALREFYEGEKGKTLPRKSALLSLGDCDKDDDENKLSLSEWFLWQNRLQSSFLMDHSKQTKNFVEMVQFLELQETLDPDEDNYGQEMEMYLIEDDILKPGQNDEEVCNIKQFFAPSSTKPNKIKKTRRSEQLQDFEEFVISGDSEDELPTIFEKKESTPVINSKSKQIKMKRRVGNTSVVDIIADTGGNDFIVSVLPGESNHTPIKPKGMDADGKPNKKKVNEEETCPVDFIDTVIIHSSPNTPDKEILESEVQCKDFTKLLPEFFPASNYNQSPPMKNDKSVWQVPEAPSISEVSLLVEDISQMAVFPKIDMTQIVKEWENCQDKLCLTRNYKTESMDLIGKTYPSKTEMTASLKSERKISLEALPDFGRIETQRNKILSNHLDVSVENVQTMPMSVDNSKATILLELNSSTEESETTNTIQISQVSEHKLNNLATVKEISERNTHPEDAVNHNVDKEGTEFVDIEMDTFSGSDDFMDTQANFVMTHEGILAELSSDGSYIEQTDNLQNNVEKEISEFNCNKVEKFTSSTDDKVLTSSLHDKSEFRLHLNQTNIKCTEGHRAAVSFFDDSFINTGVLEACKTPMENLQNVRTKTDERMPSPSQFTFTQALACVHDSDSMDRSTQNFSVDENKSVLNHHMINEGIAYEEKHKENDTQKCPTTFNLGKVNPTSEYFTLIKSHYSENSALANEAQVELINNVLNVNEDFCNDIEDVAMPLFDLGFGIDEDIIPPSPCVSQTNSQKSSLKNLSQSLLSSRKSLSFSSNRSSFMPGNCTITRDSFVSDVSKETFKYGAMVNNKVEHTISEHHGDDLLENQRIIDHIDSFDAIPKSPVLSGRRCINEKSATSAITKMSNVLSPESKPVRDQESLLEKSFVIRKKRKTRIIIDSPVTPGNNVDQDDLKSPLQLASSIIRKNLSTSSEEGSISKNKPVKSVSFCVDSIVDEMDSDFEDYLGERCNIDKINKVPHGIKDKKLNRKRKTPSNPFLLEEADVSEDNDVSSDEDEKSDEKIEDSFVSEGYTQLSQGQHEELQAIYLKSIHSPAGQAGKYKLKFNYDNNVDVYSQVPEEEESQYYQDSFVCDEEEFSMLDGHEITLMDKGNILDNESYFGPRTRWSKPKKTSNKIQQLSKSKRRRVKHIEDSSSEDEYDDQIQRLKSPKSRLISVSKKDIIESEGLNESRTIIKKRRPISSSSEEDQSLGSPQLLCSLKTRLAKVKNTSNIKMSDINVIDGNFSENIHQIDSVSDKCLSQCTEESDLLLTNRNNKPLVIVDSREINGAQDIVSSLRFQHKVDVVSAQLHSCDYAVSIRMGIDRKQWSQFSNGANRAKMTERIQDMCENYEKPCIIIEKDKVKTEEKVRSLHWTKYVDKTLVQLIQSKMMLLFTENQTETAALIGDLCHLESRKNCAITYPVNVNSVRFYRSFPLLSYVHCLFLCNNFRSVNNFLISDVNTIAKNGKMTIERATAIYNYIRRTFDSQMLPSSYS